MALTGLERVLVTGASPSGGLAATQESVSTSDIAALANAGQVLTPKSVDGILFADQFPSIQAAHDALPATGGVLVLPPSGTYVQTSEIVISKNNVDVIGQGWGTVLQRAPSLGGTATVIRVTGANCRLADFTVDGNGANVQPTGADVGIDGAGCAAERLQVINGAGTIQLRVGGVGARAAYCTVTGLGISNQTYGIWAINHVTVQIKNNTITNTGIDGIGFDGNGSQVLDNQISGCHCYTGAGGGQIVSYPISGPQTGECAIISGNVIGPGTGAASSGIECHGSNLLIDGNTVTGQQTYGIIIQTGTGNVVSNNIVRNSGQTVNIDGISVQANVTDFQITGNRCLDDQGSPTQRYGIRVEAGTSNNYIISGNDLSGNKTGALFDAGTGTAKVIAANHGVDDVLGSIASGATLTLPLNPVIAMSGSTGVGTIAADGWVGRQVTLIPAGAVVFTAGGNIGNTLTTVANVPTTATFNGTNWFLK